MLRVNNLKIALDAGENETAMKMQRIISAAETA